MTPETSIIIPAYNAEKYIEETIQSVLKQTYLNWELIIIDDGSKDHTAEKIKPFLIDSRINYYHQLNGGVSKARNNGLSKAQGQYIALLDADDTWMPNNLELKITELNSPNTDFVYSNMRLIDEQSNFKNEITVGTDSNILKHYLLWDRSVIPGPCSNLVLKKKCFEGGLQFDSQFSTAADQDFCFNLSASFIGKHIDEATWNYRILSSSMSRNIAVMEKDHIGVYKKAEKNKLFYSFWFKQKCFSNLYFILAGSWWVNGHNKLRALYFLFKGLLIYPLNVSKILKKIN